MPNWCWNDLYVAANDNEAVAQLQEFVEKSLVSPEKNEIHDGTGFSFAGTHPIPDPDNWYNWSIENWGTKWDACEPNISHNTTDYFSVNFESAWGPPLEWMKKVSEDYPLLTFTIEYEEPGMCFGGRLELHHDSGLHDCGDWEIENASECCEGKVYYQDDDEYTLTENDIVGPYPTEYQCSCCKKECETISLPIHQIKTPITIK